ncbi:hypothetical protein [Cupriavidus metallidurans]|jgi:hypothetical protein|uniref:Uncharacterized protein n=1 Tax=Cupriavidus metallidurans TaxID=119219 RepID=A0A482ITE8_9BURK|nr:hypothetical protein [Cupriavidus metallidurans]QBP10449.1 hypothetical protein DDF84_012155 [Cupriavidus metallidurans]QWC87526.1 hypothetical protein KB891_10710 [Cupriavidus metallidurans]
MSVIERLLAKQEEGFISLRQLLEEMAIEGGTTPQTAAKWLKFLFDEYDRTGEGSAPAWYQRQTVGWTQTDPDPWKDARKALARIVTTGNLEYADPKWNWEDMSDDVPF